MLNWIIRQFSGKNAEANAASQIAATDYKKLEASAREKAEALKKKGNQSFSSGDLSTAEQYYRESISIDSSYAESFNNLAMVLQQQGRHQEARGLLEQALQLDPNLVNAHYNLGSILKELQDFPKAIEHWQAALSLNPDAGNAIVGLAQLYSETSDYSAARQLLGEALMRRPESIQLHLSLGNVEKADGRISDAVIQYRKAAEYAPNDAVILYQLAQILQEQGSIDEAITFYQRADSADAQYQLGLVFNSLGKSDLALKSLKRAVEIKADDVRSLFLLGQLYQLRKDWQEAQDCLRRIIAIEPNIVEVHIELGEISKAQHRLLDAVGHFQKAVELKPEDSFIHGNLGLLFWQLGRMDESIASSRRALQYDSTLAEVYNNLGLALKDQGQAAEAVEAFRKAIVLRPDMVGWYSNLLLSLQYVSNIDPKEVFREHVRFGELVEAPLKADWQPHLNQSDPDRRLKIGYVSGDFRNHAVAFFVEPIFANHDKSQFEIYAYHSHHQHDKYTDQIAKHFDHWLVCADMSDGELAERIRADQIDILIDLSGHTAFNRLPVFARKPAPVQATWIGYQATTGLRSMDYRLTDESLDPIGTTEQFHTESLLRMASAGQFKPSKESPPVNPLPALFSKKLTLGCLNNLAKLNQEVIEVWAEILRALPDAQLMLGNASGKATKDGLIAMFAKEGITADRLLLQDKTSLAQYLALHNQIDFALDTFPYNGGTTTFHALWMGVPVLALAGDTPVSRAGVAIMKGVSLPEFGVQTKQEYVQRAIEISRNLPRLNEIRQQLRHTLTVLFESDPTCVVSSLESTYRDMWKQWCAKN